MSDLIRLDVVEELRALARDLMRGSGVSDAMNAEMLSRAAKEIEALRESNLKLLAACQSMVGRLWWLGEIGPESEAWIRDAEAAIAKAHGKEGS